MFSHHRIASGHAVVSWPRWSQPLLGVHYISTLPYLFYSLGLQNTGLSFPPSCPKWILAFFKPKLFFSCFPLLGSRLSCVLFFFSELPLKGIHVLFTFCLKLFAYCSTSL